MKHITTLLIEKYEDFNVICNRDLKEAIELDIKEQKDNLKPHEWWKEDEIVARINDLTMAHKYRIISYQICDYFDEFFKNKSKLQNIFQDIENYLTAVNEEELKEVEILLLERIINILEDQEDFNNFINQYAGKLTKKLISDNNEFWENLPNLND